MKSSITILLLLVVVGLQSASAERRAWATLVCNDEFSMGGEALGQSLIRSGTSAEMIAMVVPRVSTCVRDLLTEIGWKVVEVQLIDNPFTKEVAHIQCVFSKLQAWAFTEFDKIVYLDVDTVVMTNVDDLFERPGFSAAPDIFPPDIFNAGVLVLEPSETTFRDILSFNTSSWDMTDQQFLNNYVESRLGKWFTLSSEHRLPFTDNALTKLKLYNNWSWMSIRSKIRIVHFSGWEGKPWQVPDEKNPSREPVAGGDEEIIGIWQSAYAETPGARRLNHQRIQGYVYDDRDGCEARSVGGSGGSWTPEDSERRARAREQARRRAAGAGGGGVRENLDDRDEDFRRRKNQLRDEEDDAEDFIVRDRDDDNEVRGGGGGGDGGQKRNNNNNKQQQQQQRQQQRQHRDEEEEEEEDVSPVRPPPLSKSTKQEEDDDDDDEDADDDNDDDDKSSTKPPVKKRGNGRVDPQTWKNEAQHKKTLRKGKVMASK